MLKKFETTIPAFGLNRTIHLWLPDDYDQTTKRCPVLYMFDGHNLFLDEDATYGKSWGLADYLRKTGTELIVVGMECNHEGNQRLAEYSPYPLPKRWEVEEARGKETMDWFAYELKPQIDREYRTLPDRAHTMLAGSSMGGLMSVYGIAKYNSVYGGAACLSSSVHMVWDALTEELSQLRIDPETKIYLSFGGEELRQKKQLAAATWEMLELAHFFEEQGARAYPYVHQGGRHCEASWEEEIPVFLPWLMKR